MNFAINKLETHFFQRCAAKYGWHWCNKAILQATGLMHRRDRMPMPHLNDEQFTDIESCYRDIVATWQASRPQVVVA